ncbi:hypothetical protein BDN67DRAFT_1012629 [Paxillus ammoniavirescens]|nr:hypothetical protein BDN67DRAFT_1012629 [Paxillus ammoniavirescens]
MTSSCPPVIAFPPPPPTSNTLSSRERSVLVRSSKKLGRILGDVPRFVDEDPNTIFSSRSSTSSGLSELMRTTTNTSTASLVHKADAESSWHKRKPTHLPPLLKLSGAVAVDSPSPTWSPASHRATRRGSILSTAPSIVSNAPSTVSGSSNSDVPSASSQRRTKIERLRRKLGDEVPFDAVFPSSSRSPRSPHTPRTAVPKTPRGRPSTHARSHARSRSTHTRADDARSIAFSISSDEGVQTVTLSASTHVRSPHPHKSKHTYQTGALPPVPPLPAHMSSSRRAQGDGDDAGLIRPRQKVTAGSKIGGSDFKAARRAKREGRSQTGQADVGELIEMVGFMGGGF